MFMSPHPPRLAQKTLLFSFIWCSRNLRRALLRWRHPTSQESNTLWEGLWRWWHHPWIPQVLRTRWHCACHNTERWKMLIIITVPKSGGLSNPNNYKGIGLISLVTKLYNRMIMNQLRLTLEPLFRTPQNGFRTDSGPQASARCQVEQRQLRTDVYWLQEGLRYNSPWEAKGNPAYLWSSWEVSSGSHSYILTNMGQSENTWRGHSHSKFWRGCFKATHWHHSCLL